MRQTFRAEFGISVDLIGFFKALSSACFGGHIVGQRLREASGRTFSQILFFVLKCSKNKEEHMEIN